MARLHRNQRTHESPASLRTFYLHFFKPEFLFIWFWGRSLRARGNNYTTARGLGNHLIEVVDDAWNLPPKANAIPLVLGDA